MQEIRRAAERAVDLTLPAERNAIAAYLNLAMVGSPKAVPSLYSDADERLTRVLRDAQPRREAGMPVDATSDYAHSADAGIAVSDLYTGSAERGPGGRPRPVLPPALRHTGQR